MATEGATFLLNAQLRAVAEVAHGLSAALEFVAAVDAVVESVTSQRSIDAVTATAPELVRRAQSLRLLQV